MRSVNYMHKTLLFIITMITLGFSSVVQTIEEKIEYNNGIDFKKNIILSSMPIQPLADKLTQTSFIFIGENHTEYSNHIKQLEIIKALYQKNKNISIGMEMFSSSYNKIISEYISKKITEAELLKFSNYFLEWGYDYQYYKDILDFARKNNIDVIGLNIKNDIIRKIGRHSFQDITQEELKEIPDQIDFSNVTYKNSLSQIFTQHPGYENKLPDNFYLSQLIRDEYMAQSASQYIKANPQKTMILLVGNGHVEFGFGIPKRLQRITGKSNQIIVLDLAFKPGAADYFVYTQHVKMKTSPRLKVMISSTNEKVTVIGFSSKEIKDKHVLKEKDEILSLNNVPVHSIADIRLFLYDKKPGDIIEISLVRGKQPIIEKYTLEENEDEE
ncbi:MAG: ChaN family lipoprotein [Spirochaetia bacterium]|nr:ChaN family lipoprotein [Spirochaetia bacterium]